MTASREWTIDFSEAAAARLRDGSLDRVLGRPVGRAQWEETLADARVLTAPAAVWEWVTVEDIRDESVILEGGARLAGGPLAEVVAGAEQLGLCVCTVGHAISDRIRERQDRRQLLCSVLLDEMGSWAVDAVRQQVCRRLAAESAAAGLRVSASLSPGESEWPLADQAVIFGLVDAGAIGVTLGPTLLMSPPKSLTLVLGRGRRPLGREDGDDCGFCVIRDRCGWRGRRCAREAAEAT